MKRLAAGRTQRVPVPPPLLGGELSRGDRVIVYQDSGPRIVWRKGSVTELPHLRSNRVTVRYDA